MTKAVLERAIRQQKVISFLYQGEDAPGFQIVEPYQMEPGRDGEPVLRGWLLDGWTSTGKGWREYPLRKMAEVSVLPNRFAPREASSAETTLVQ